MNAHRTAFLTSLRRLRPTSLLRHPQSLSRADATALMNRRSHLQAVPFWFAEADTDGRWNLALPLAALAETDQIDLLLNDIDAGSLYRLRLSGRYLLANWQAFAHSADGSALLLQLSAAAVDRFQDRHPSGHGREFAVFLRTTLHPRRTVEGSWQAPYPDQFRLPPVEQGG